jgi:8-oxo-dGTP pyrophosphatase MutT (NUDIX family)
VTVLIDPPAWAAHGRLFCHLASDTSLEELHEVARRAGLPPQAFEGDHYDVPQERYADAVAAGAVPVTAGELARRLRDSGLRFRKRLGERPLGRRANGLEWIGQDHVVEVVSSSLEPPTSAGAAVVLVTTVDLLLLVRNTTRSGWAAPGGKRDAGETIRQTAVREVQEEVGLALDPDRLAPVGYERVIFPTQVTAPAPWDRMNHIAVFGAQLPEPTPLRPDPREIAEAEWLSWAEVERRAGQQVFWPLLARWRDRGLRR